LGEIKMNTCKTCKFKGEEISVWDYELDEPIEKNTGYFSCNRIKHGGVKDDNHKLGNQACVVDGSGYYAALITEDTFGCILWEK
jgi:hypothetical protein